MASIKIVLQKRPDKQGKLPLSIRVIKDRKTSYSFIGHSLNSLDEWDEDKQRVKKTHPNSARLNNLLLKKLAKINDKLLELETQNKEHSAKTVIKTAKPEKSTSFFDVAETYLDNMRKEGKYDVNAQKPRIKHFKQFLKGEDIAFSDITVDLLERYKAYLKSTSKVGKTEKKTVSDRTIVNHIILIRTIYNRAIESGIANRNDYPFGKGKISIKIPSGVKIGLNQEDIKKLEDFANSIEEIKDFSFITERKIQDGLKRKKAPLTEDEQQRLTDMSLFGRQYLKHATNLWLFSFYFAGIRLSDLLLLKWSDFQNGRLYYSMGKNNKTGSLKVPIKAMAILEQYKIDIQKNDLVFPELKILDRLDDKYEVKRKTSYVDKRLIKALKVVANENEITKDIKPHGARHAFGNISGENISLQMLQKLYRHTSITTTVIYQGNFIHKDADDALDAVVDF